MSEFSNSDQAIFAEWRQKIAIANRHNIFCHCRDCGEEWVDSHRNVSCPACQSQKLEYIACWQFPDG
ncbi:hydrogenase maturation nickel metallochaperone HypA [Spirulina subsalsa FACHB-351]|uniref:Hydrogenase maturation nickel metallochaperone HypA n=1 Tax=Spirulina subsalsa FACHB-351 TaxID=234711 RepID=A0ABT3L6F4_9CYAN|nr:hydrogenase maturation nickel metallochaperone HypA [Spirulina subsalsa]MCW6037087.1 hydrogenase maturation nickel metallochaperone HypA [Spirulina subsalsa FACHB-351]